MDIDVAIGLVDQINETIDECLATAQEGKVPPTLYLGNREFQKLRAIEYFNKHSALGEHRHTYKGVPIIRVDRLSYMSIEAPGTGTIAFDEAMVNKLIVYWREKLCNSKDAQVMLIAECYIDAYQTVRVNHGLDPLGVEFGARTRI